MVTSGGQRQGDLKLKTEDHPQNVPNRVLIQKHGGTLQNWTGGKRLKTPEKWSTRIETKAKTAEKVSSY